MYRFISLVSAVLIVFLFAGFTYSQDSIKVVSKKTNEEADLNYIAGVKTANLGLKVSAAYYLGERKSEKSVIPLMNMLKSDPSPEARIMAALSLYKIGNEKGIFAIERAAQFDKNEQVKRMCGILYQMYEMDKKSKKE